MIFIIKKILYYFGTYLIHKQKYKILIKKKIELI